MTTTPELLTAINETMQAVGYVQKQRTQGLRYSYAGEAALLAALRPAMVANGLVMVPLTVDARQAEHGKAKSGAMQWRCDGVWTFRLLHTSGGYIDVQAVSNGIDAGDKAPFKAATGALKYALRHTFLIETGDDPDPYPSEAQEVEAAPMVQMSAAAFRAEMADAFARLDITNAEMDAFCDAHKMPPVDDMTDAMRDKVIQRLHDKNGEPLESWLANHRNPEDY